ncbi:MAG: DUF835 domain-containing protein [Candidatus Thermoplasmatota archaeon]|jgi:hypothetical protein|nr:DUF835 domain-containing protein [Candidatus Thermoplasmatota archaeon]
MEELTPLKNGNDGGTDTVRPAAWSSVDLESDGALAVGSQVNALKDPSDGYLVLGRSSSSHMKWGRKGLLELGAVGEHQTSGEDLFGRKVMVDAAFPHIIFICGKRGSGKSYTLGILAEELIRSAIGVGVVLIDPIGIFWSLKKENASQSERDEMARWGLRPQSFPEARVLVPSGSRMEKEGSEDGPFTISVGEMTADDWCHVFELERFRTQGLMIGTIIEQVQNGYDSVSEGRILHIGGRGDRFSISDIVQCIDTSLLINSKTGGFSPQTRRSISARFTAASGWGIFDLEGTPLRDLSSANRITVLDVSDPNLGDSKRSLITGMVARKVLSARIRAARLEENGTVNEADPDNIPVTWLLIDEAHIILPHGRQTTATEALVEYTKQGRKPGCALILATQRPASTSDEILSQVDILIGHNLALEDDMTAMRRRVPSKLPAEFANSDFIRAIPVGTSIIADQRTQQRAFLLRVRPRLSHHAGSSAMPKAFMESRPKHQILPISSTSAGDRAPTPRSVGRQGRASSRAVAATVQPPMEAPGTMWSAAPSAGTPPSSGMDLTIGLKGRSILMLENDANRTLKALEASGGVNGVITFTRLHPDRLSVPPALGETSNHWLSSTPGDGTIPPTDLQSISMEAQAFLEGKKGSVVLIEGVDFLLKNNGDGPLRHLLQALHEKVVLGEHTLIVVLEPGVENGLIELVSPEMDVVLGRTDAPTGPPETKGQAQKGALTRSELVWMCTVLGLPTDGTEDELLHRMDALRMEGVKKVEGTVDGPSAPSVKEAVDGTRQVLGERMAVKNAISDLESKVSLDEGDHGRSHDTGRKRRSGKARPGRLVLVWDDVNKVAREGSKEDMETIMDELDGIKERASVPLLKGTVSAPQDPLVTELIERMERDRKDDMRRIEGLERALKEGLEGLKAGTKSGPTGPKGTPVKATEKEQGPPSPQEKVRMKARVLKEGLEVVIVRPSISEGMALQAARGDLKRSFLRGPRETIDELVPVFAPLYRFRVRYKGWLPGSSKEGDILFDALLGEIVWTGGSGLKRSLGLPRLLSLTEKESALMVNLTRTAKDDEGLSRDASLTLRDTRRLLTSLAKKGLVKRRTQEARTYVYSLPEDLDLPGRPWSRDLGIRPERTSVEERLLGPIFSSVDAERVISHFLGGARLIEHDTLHYPYFAVKVSGEGRIRYIAVDGRTGKVDREMSSVIGKALKGV